MAERHGVPSTWVVFSARARARQVWVWCRHDGGPNFAELHYTEVGGLDPAPDAAEAELPPDKYLFTVTDPVSHVPAPSPPTRRTT